MNEKWVLRESVFAIETNRAYEGLFTLGNGYLHTRGSLEEHLADAPQNHEYLRLPANVTAEKFPATKEKWCAFLPGVTGPHPTMRQEMVNLPHFLWLAPWVEGEKLDMESSRVEGGGRALDMKTATLRRKLTWTTRAGARIAIRYETFLHAQRRHLALQRMTLSSDREVTVTLRAGFDSDVRTSGYDHLAERALSPEGGNGLRCEVATNGGETVSMASRLSSSTETAWRYEDEERRGCLAGEIVLKPGETATVEKRTAVASSHDLDQADVLQVLDDAAPAGFDVLHADHARAWAARWERADVAIDGDDETQMALRASIYHLLRSHVPDDPRVTIDAKACAGDAYFGRYFWDTEMYMLPFYLYTAPARARTFVDFRVGTLGGARKNAERMGYNGAKYAWESGLSGEECCAAWQYADHEVHVTADVVYGLAHYAAAAEPEYLRGPAAEVLAETGRYWLDRVDVRQGEDYPSLLGVMGPDEYSPICANNAYTNSLVKFALEIAARHADAGGASEEECGLFREIAAGLRIVHSAKDPELVLQCEEFDSYAEPQFDRYWPDRKGCYAAAVSQERLYREKCCKQADVLMLMMLFPDAFTDAQVEKAWHYYLPYTTHDSSLSVGIHAIVALRLGREREAWTLFQKGLYKDVDVTGGGAEEGIHIAGCACNWMVVTLGFAGLRTALQAQTLTLEPKLPAQWSRLTFPLVWRGVPLRVELTRGVCKLTNEGERNLEAVVAGQTVSVEPGAETVVTL